MPEGDQPISRRCRRELLVCGTVALALSLLWIWPQVADLGKVPDRSDPVFSGWRLAWLADHLHRDPRHLFDANIFHPRRWTLAYSDATLLQGVLASPLIWAGMSPLGAANVMLVLAFPLCALAFFYAAWRLTHSPPAALVAGVLGAWYPFHAEHFSHLELQWFMFAPLAIVASLDAISSPTWRRGSLAGLLVVAQCLASMYLGLMLVSVLVPIITVAVVRRGPGPAGRLVAALAGMIVVVASFAAALAVPYRHARMEHGERGDAEVERGSARPGDYLSTPRRLTTYRWHERAHNIPERELFPGTTTLVLAGAGAVSGAATVVPLLAGGIAAFDWSLGHHGVSYRWLARAVPPYRSIRVPARFAALVGTVLILLSACGMRRILAGRGRRTQMLVTSGVLLVTAFDLRLTLELVNYPRGVPAFQARLGPESVVAALPAGREIDYMYFSTVGWNRLLTGYSGFIPRDDDLRAALDGFPAASSIAFLRARGATHLTYVCAFERSPDRCSYNAAELATRGTLELLAEERWQGAPARLYRFK